MTIAKELELGGYIVSGAYSADNKSTLAIFEPTGNGDYKFSTSTNRNNSDEISCWWRCNKWRNGMI